MVDESAQEKKKTKNTLPAGLARPQPSELGEEMGVATNFPVSSWDSFSFGQDFGKASSGGHLLPRDAEAVPLDKLVRMRRRDGQTRSLQRIFVLPILACLKEGEWVTPGEAEDAEDEVEFANNMWNLPPTRGGMTVTKRHLLKQTLLAIVEGFSLFEEVRQVPEKGPLKGKITLRKLAHRDSRTIQFKIDDTGGFAGVRQLARKPNGETLDISIPAEKCLFYTCNGEEAPFYGVSMFESSWYHYDIKTKLYYVAHVASQTAAVPGRIGTYPLAATNGQKAAFKKALADFAMNTALAVPTGYTVTPFNSNTGFDLIRLIDHHSHLQAKSVLLQFADSENRVAIIDNGGQDASADMFVQALQSIMDEIAELWSTHLMPKYIDWNFNSGKYPVFRFGSLTDSSRDAIKEVFQSIVTSSVLNCTPEFMREVEMKLATRLGLDVDYKEIAAREAEAQEKAAELAEAQAQAAEAAQQGDPNAQPGDGGANADPAQPGDGGAPAAAAPSGAVPGMPDAQPITAGVAQGGDNGVSLSDAQASIDDIVQMAERLFASRPVYELDEEQ